MMDRHGSHHHKGSCPPPISASLGAALQLGAVVAFLAHARRHHHGVHVGLGFGHAPSTGVPDMGGPQSLRER
jgi:hypothetical protein